MNIKSAHLSNPECPAEETLGLPSRPVQNPPKV